MFKDPFVKQVLDETRFERGLIAEASKYRAQRDELLAALQTLVGDFADLGEVDLDNPEREALDAARAAIAKATTPTSP